MRPHVCNLESIAYQFASQARQARCGRRREPFRRNETNQILLGGITGVRCPIPSWPTAPTGCPGSTNRAAPDPVGATRASATDQAEAGPASLSLGWAPPPAHYQTRFGARLLRITREQAPLFFSAMTTRRVIDAAFPHVPDAGLSFQCPDFPSLLRQIQRVKQSQVCENWGARFFVLVYPLIAWG